MDSVDEGILGSLNRRDAAAAKIVADTRKPREQGGGGSTYHLRDEEFIPVTTEHDPSVRSIYMVGGEEMDGERVPTRQLSQKQFHPTRMHHEIVRSSILGRNDPDAMLGTWRVGPPSGGRLFGGGQPRTDVDMSKAYDHLPDATRVAHQRGEEAVFGNNPAQDYAIDYGGDYGGDSGGDSGGDGGMGT